MRPAASILGRVLSSARSAGTRSFAAEAAPAVASDIGYVAQVNAQMADGSVLQPQSPQKLLPQAAGACATCWSCTSAVNGCGQPRRSRFLCPSSQVIGPVVDVRFDGELPDIMSCLEVR